MLGDRGDLESGADIGVRGPGRRQRAQALFETTAEVCQGLVTAADHYEQKTPAWHMERHPLRADMITNGSRLLSFRNLVWYEQTVSDAPDAFTGFIDTDAIPLHPDADVYLCGPVPFMQVVRAGLHRRGVPDERIRYEVFGSEQWRPAPVPTPA
ncbi:hypothetical protein ACTWPT_46290 [Nonomuraea sp. 3N208]|uniref:hypothetical protein n=1 Tax=Nonomuraea sp. 3N208 TaxID=3457421 RepID=UPI003FD0F565